MKQYSEYKDSGVKWIGDIPSHWEIKRTAIMFSENKDKNSKYEFSHAFKFNYGTLVPKNETGEISEYRETYEAYTIIKKDDIAINCLNLNYDFVSQRVAISPNNGILTSAYLIITPRQGVNPYYYNYLFKSMDSKKMFHGMGTGIRLTLSYTELRKQFLPFPPLPEQQAIVSYLDAKVSKIDRYIATATKKIAALDELKQVTIANAVTKGINPNAPMEDSGTPWIGMVPENWETLRAKNIFERQFREVKDDDDIVTCFRDGQVTLRKNRRTDGFTESIKEIGYQGIRKGDLVIHQMDAFAGSIGVSDSDGKGTPVYICCLPKGESNVFYYAYLLREMARTGFIKSLYRGIRERSSDFRFETFAVQWLPVPPLTEQTEIVAYIDRKVAQIDKMRTAELSQIEKLKEYKQRLISDVVTGKVKVTND